MRDEDEPVPLLAKAEKGSLQSQGLSEGQLSWDSASERKETAPEIQPLP